ncbi:MAG TPA: PatB family C-S lyase [Burkholderiales bacterium]|nr:PatB family C-S lyase [Burkholderiales bacterium]
MPFDFDAPVERAGTWSTRWDRYGPEVIPLWVADTDFRAAPAVLRALQERLGHGVLGYTAPPEALREAIVARCRTRYGWTIDASWIVFLPGVVPGLHLAARKLVPPDGHALVPRPVYHHFKRALELAPRAHDEVPLVLDSGRWVLDLDVVHRSTGSTTLFLCNPQNPGGTVFRRGELEQLAGLTRGMTIVSDEIHCDLVLEPGVRHVPIASLGPEVSRRSVTLMSATKAYNFPAAGCAWAVIEDAGMREAFSADVRAHALPSPSVFGYVATLAAYREGDDWLAAQNEYLRANREMVLDALKPLPIARPEATYLAWIDCSRLEGKDPHRLFLEAGVALSPGSQFGEPRFVRLNFATQRARLAQALERMRSALTRLA